LSHVNQDCLRFFIYTPLPPFLGSPPPWGTDSYLPCEMSFLSGHGPCFLFFSVYGPFQWGPEFSGSPYGRTIPLLRYRPPLALSWSCNPAPSLKRFLGPVLRFFFFFLLLIFFLHNLPFHLLKRSSRFSFSGWIFQLLFLALQTKLRLFFFPKVQPPLLSLTLLWTESARAELLDCFFFFLATGLSLIPASK